MATPAPVSTPPYLFPTEPSFPTAPSEEPYTTGEHAMSRSTPVRVSIPAIGVDSDLMGLGLASDNSMEVPPGAFPAGWYTGAPTPGELGPAIIVGHVDWRKELGVFHDLAELKPGDDVAVLRKDGRTAHFRVTSVEQYAKNRFPTATVYGNIDHAGLRLVTCGGEINRELRSHEDNIVVFADLVGTS